MGKAATDGDPDERTSQAPPLPRTRHPWPLLRGLRQRDDHQLHDLPLGGAAPGGPLAAPAHAIIYRALLGDEAGTPTKAPGDAHELRECLALTDAVPRAARALERLAEADPHWRAVARNYDTLRRNMAHETGGAMLHPWPSGTSRQLRQISARIFGGEDPDQIEAPDLAQNTP